STYLARSLARFSAHCRSSKRDLCFSVGYGGALNHAALTRTVRRFCHLANGNRRKAAALLTAIRRAVVDRVSARCSDGLLLVHELSTRGRVPGTHGGARPTAR